MSTATKKKPGRKALDYRVFERTTNEEGRTVLVEVETPVPEKPGHRAVYAALKKSLRRTATPDDNGREFIVVGLGESLKVEVETKRVVSFDE